MEAGDASSKEPGAPASQSHPDVQGAADQAAKRVGTGMFLPLVGRTYTRNKYSRRKNLSSSSLPSGQATAGRQPPRRNTSTESLAHPNQQQRQHESSTGSSSCDGGSPGPHVEQQYASGSQGPVLMGPGVYLPVADACALAGTTYIVMNGSGPVLASSTQCQTLQHMQHMQHCLPLQLQQQTQLLQHQPQQLQQPLQLQHTQLLQQQPQQLSPFAVVPAASSSACAVPLNPTMTVGSHTGMGPVVLQQAVSVPADTRVYSSSAQLYPSTGLQLSSSLQQYAGTLQQFHSTGTGLLDVVGPCSTQGLVGAGSLAGNQQEGLLTDMFLQAPACNQGCVLTSSAAGGAHSDLSVSQGPTVHTGGFVSAPVLLSDAHATLNSIMAHADTLDVYGRRLLEGVAAALPCSSDGRSPSPEVLRLCIQHLDVLKGLVARRAQLRGQQLLLKLQPHGQQQQVALGMAGSALQQCLADATQLQQELTQLMVRQQGESGALLPGTQAPAVGVSFDGTVNLPVAYHGDVQAATPQAEPTLLTWLQQQQPQQQHAQQQVQLSSQMLQSQNIIDLSNMMNDSLTLQPQQQQVQQAVMSSPALLMPQGSHQIVMVNANQCF